MPVNTRCFLIREHMIAAHRDIRRRHFCSDAKIWMVAGRKVVKELSPSHLKDFLRTIWFQLLKQNFANSRPFIDEAVIVLFNLTGQRDVLALPFSSLVEGAVIIQNSPRETFRPQSDCPQLVYEVTII